MKYKFTAEKSNKGSYRKTEIEANSLLELKRILSLAGLKEDNVGEGYMDEEGYLLDNYESSNKTTDVEFTEDGDMTISEGELWGDWGHEDEPEDGEEEDLNDDDYGLTKSEPDNDDRPIACTHTVGNPLKVKESREKYNIALTDAAHEIAQLIKKGVKPYGITEKLAGPIASSYKVSLSDVIEQIEEVFINKYKLDPVKFSSHLEDKISEHKIIKEREEIEESICQLLNNNSKDLLNAFTKIREGKYNNLNDNEISNLAAAFINIIRETQMDKLLVLNKLFERYFLDNKLKNNYSKIIKENSR